MKSFLKKTGAVWLAAVLIFPDGIVLGVRAAQSGNGKSSGAVTMDGISVDDDQVRITLSGPVKYKTMKTASPPRLIVDLLNTEHRVGIKSLVGKGDHLVRVRVGQFETDPKMISRVVLDMSSAADFRISGIGDALVISLSPAAVPAEVAEEESAEAPAQALAQAAAPAPEQAAAPAPEQAAAPVPQAPKPKRPVMVSASVGLPAPSMAAHPGPLSAKNAPALQEMAQSGDVYGRSRRASAGTLKRRRELAGKIQQQRATVRADIMNRLPKDKVTLDFDNTGLPDIIRLLASKAKVNIIHGPDVGGTLTLHLRDVPFDEAFRTILTMRGLTTLQVGDNVLRIITPEDLAKQLLNTTGVTKVIPLNYVKAEEIIAHINAVRSAEGRKGLALADTKTNALIITDSLAGILSTERLISRLDIMPQQVMIEAKLVEVALNNDFHVGIQWDYWQADLGGEAFGKQGNSFVGTTVGTKSDPITMPLDQNLLKVNNPGGDVRSRGTGVALAATEIVGALTLGRVTNNYFLNATLSAAARKGKVKVLSDPKIATLNNEEAKIEVTNQNPYVTSSVASTGVATESVSYVTTGITLTVTPTINADGRITLKIQPTVSKPAQAAAAAGTTGATGIDTRTVKTTVIVDDSETIVIGGLISDSVETSVLKLPLLGDIPVLGWLFKKKSIIRRRNELLVFVTPKILDV